MVLKSHLFEVNKSFKMVHAKSFVLWTFVLVACALAKDSELVNEVPKILDICALMPHGTTILRPGSCTNWIKCSSNEDNNNQGYEEGSCLFGLYYDKNTGKCDLAERVNCPYDSRPNSRCEDEKDDTFLSDPNNCTAYIFCKNGEELHANCPGDLVFHPEKAACVYKQDYTCPPQALLPKPHPMCLSISDNRTFADELSCETFHTCQKGVLAIHKCDEGSFFNHLKGSCVPNDRSTCIPTAVEAKPMSTVCGTVDQPKVGYFSDEESCSGYYFCKKVANGVDLDPVFANCPNGFFFDIENLSCRDRLNVQCKGDRCEGMGNKYVNIFGDCSSYARCLDNKLDSVGKCPESYFFDEKTQGCTPQKIQYAACSA